MLPDTFPQRIVYGVVDDALIFVAEDYATEALTTIAAWRAVSTYGEAAALYARPSCVDAPGHAEEAHLEPPDTEFDAADDEWWPTFHGVLAARVWAPECTVGTRERTLVTEDWVTFAATEETAFLALVETHGVTVRRDDELIATLREP